MVRRRKIYDFRRRDDELDPGAFGFSYAAENRIGPGRNRTSINKHADPELSGRGSYIHGWDGFRALEFTQKHT
jgi:hypothetical protein